MHRAGAIIAGLCDLLHKLHYRKLALTGEAAEMSTPLQHVQFKPRRIGNLNKRDFIPGYFRDGRKVATPRENMKAVENNAKVRVVSLFNNIPCGGEIGGVAPPGQGFVA